ncbi:GNAT family N-acetyltransferase [Singulisphaera rosea]
MNASPLVHVRDARPADLDVIVEYNARLADETEGKHLDRSTLALGVKAALAEPDRLRYWVAENREGGSVVGQAAITREWSDWRNGWLWWFQSVYVAQEHRGGGIFRTLYHHIRDQALSTPDVIGLRLYVEPENHRAQAVYRSLGMLGSYHVYEDLWTERFDPANRPIRDA